MATSLFRTVVLLSLLSAACGDDSSSADAGSGGSDATSDATGDECGIIREALDATWDTSDRPPLFTMDIPSGWDELLFVGEENEIRARLTHREGHPVFRRNTVILNVRQGDVLFTAAERDEAIAEAMALGAVEQFTFEYASEGVTVFGNGAIEDVVLEVLFWLPFNDQYVNVNFQFASSAVPSSCGPDVEEQLFAIVRTLRENASTTFTPPVE
ncbi:MAG: hypothetical protein AAGE52_15405 [Myxococcota bacterium]